MICVAARVQLRVLALHLPRQRRVPLRQAMLMARQLSLQVARAEQAPPQEARSLLAVRRALHRPEEPRAR